MSAKTLKLKTGFTTGTCAQAAAKGAGLMLVTQKLLERVEVETPCGVKLCLNLIDQKIEKKSAFCGIIKDAGDDPDITNGIKICAEVRFSSKKGVSVIGGEGVGMAAKPGLAIGVGEYAINPVPRKMIIKEASRYLPKDRGLEVVISVPRGEELAKHTFNPRIGIAGGISIIGTTGIVEPKSTSAYKSSLSLQLDVLKASGAEKAVLVLGYVGERFVKEALKLRINGEPSRTINLSTELRINGERSRTIKIGDHVGFMLKECAKKKIKEVLLAGHIGKLVKIAKGQFNTHSEFGDNRIETIAHYAKACGAKRSVVKELLRQTTAEATVDILRKNMLMEVFGKIAQKIVININEFLDNEIRVSCVLLSLKGEILRAYPDGISNRVNPIRSPLPKSRRLRRLTSDGVNKIYVIGVGPGTRDYLLPIAKKEIEKSDCLIGAERILNLFADLNKEKIHFEGRFDDVIPYIKENRAGKKIAVLVSGDPGMYSFLGQLSKILSKEEYTVIPGISAVQMAFAKIGENWQDAEIISLHGRRPANLAELIKASPKVFLFTDAKFPPPKIAEYLLSAGVGNRNAIVFTDLGYPNERIVDMRLKDLSKAEGFGLCAMAIKK